MLEQKPAPNITASITSNSSTLRQSNKLRLGIIGLGKMGGNLALQAMEKNIAVIGKTRGPRPDLERNGVKVVDDYESFVSYLDKPRLIYLSLPAGPTIDNVLKEVLPYLEKGDGNSCIWIPLDGKKNSLTMESIFLIVEAVD
jgi:6-phosphogluconate dehydrogenase